MEIVKLEHGSGGVEMHELLEKLIFRRVEDKLKRVGNGVGIDIPDDAAAIPTPDGKYLVVSVDSYTVNPIFFPGGNIGILAVSGTINDVLMMGGIPIAMLDTIVVEEGFPIRDLEIIIESMLKILREEEVALVGGDFKVMPRGQVDKLVITTTGIGIADKPIIDYPEPGDKIIVSDYIGDHGATILMLQMGVEKDVEKIFKSMIKSDVKPLTKLMKSLLTKHRDCITAARDPTRGGLAGVLNEWVRSRDFIVYLNENEIPIREPVKRFAETLGVDPLYLASEGVAVLSIKEECASDVIRYIWHLGFENARIIGEVRESRDISGVIVAETSIGGLRIVEPPRGEIVPRIC
ncbi:MAG: hydrogenase expression/formation protein HypE [Desulfurococcaceae archaeon]